MEKMMERPAIMDDDTGYSAVVQLPEMGQDVELQFNDTGNFCFNQIDCASEQACMAVGKALLRTVQRIRAAIFTRLQMAASSGRKSSLGASSGRQCP